MYSLLRKKNQIKAKVVRSDSINGFILFWKKVARCGGLETDVLYPQRDLISTNDTVFFMSTVWNLNFLYQTFTLQGLISKFKHFYWIGVITRSYNVVGVK